MSERLTVYTKHTRLEWYPNTRALLRIQDHLAISHSPYFPIFHNIPLNYLATILCTWGRYVDKTKI